MSYHNQHTSDEHENGVNDGRVELVLNLAPVSAKVPQNGLIQLRTELAVRRRIVPVEKPRDPVNVPGIKIFPLEDCRICAQSNNEPEANHCVAQETNQSVHLV
jgi:hypothetical protein